MTSAEGQHRPSLSTNVIRSEWNKGTIGILIISVSKWQNCLHIKNLMIPAILVANSTKLQFSGGAIKKLQSSPGVLCNIYSEACLHSPLNTSELKALADLSQRQHWKSSSHFNKMLCLISFIEEAFKCVYMRLPPAGCHNIHHEDASDGPGLER